MKRIFRCVQRQDYERVLAYAIFIDFAFQLGIGGVCHPFSWFIRTYWFLRRIDSHGDVSPSLLVVSRYYCGIFLFKMEEIHERLYLFKKDQNNRDLLLL